MAIDHAMWVHGHSAQIEYPDRVSAVERRGPSVRIHGKNGTKNWFHVAVPTPVLVDGKRLRLASTLLRFRTSGAGCRSAHVQAVHVYDAERSVVKADGLDLHPHAWSLERLDTPTSSAGHPEVLFGVGVSVLVDYPWEASPWPLEDGWIDLAAAGCDFV